ncbi:MAG TPA: DUF4886 domain-containing protein [Gemmataceae bacterium]|nr:DUF4886 domain-containing protein [Gemmataceae bacterium]
MRCTRRIFLAIAVFCVAIAPAQAQEKQKPVRVLFIGNSFTFVNDLPNMIAELAKAVKQLPLEHGQETPGGCSFEKHWKDGKAATKIAAGPWDYVVLQEQSQRPLTGRAVMFEFATKLDGEIKKHKAKTLLYQTWARQDEPTKQDALSKAYLDLGKELKASVAPVGTAWQNALQKNPKLVLHAADKSHPCKTGTYLAACVFYGTIYAKSPEDLPGNVGGLADGEAKTLQAIAWETVRQLTETKKQ